MELERHTKDELKNLVNVPKLAIEDSTIENMISILNKDSTFQEIIKLKKGTKGSSLSANLKTRVINYNIDKMKRRVEIRYKLQPLYDLTLEDYYRYFIVHSVLHEATHIDQSNKSNHGLYPYSDLNTVYTIAIDAAQRASIMDLIIYKIFHRYFFYERNADNDASKLAMEIFDDENLNLFAETFYFNNLLLWGYSLKGDKVISPVERTMKYLNKKHVMLDNDVPFDIAFEHGLPITTEEYHYIFDYVQEVMKEKKELDTKIITERIQKLTLESKGMSTDN